MACFGLKVFFLCEFDPQNHNCLVRIKFGNYSNSSIQVFWVFHVNIHLTCFGQKAPPFLAIFCDRKLNWSVYNGNWFPYQFQYAEFCGNVHVLGGKYPFGEKYPREAPSKYFFFKFSLKTCLIKKLSD